MDKEQFDRQVGRAIAPLGYVTIRSLTTIFHPLPLEQIFDLYLQHRGIDRELEAVFGSETFRDYLTLRHTQALQAHTRALTQGTMIYDQRQVQR